MLTKEEVEQLKGQHPGEVMNAVLNHICDTDKAGYELLRTTPGFATAIQNAVGGRLLPETSGGDEDAFLGFCWDSRGAAGE